MSFPAILALEDGSIFYGDGFGEKKLRLEKLFSIHQ
jgi:carbamoylphosphate synthase small subunit